MSSKGKKCPWEEESGVEVKVGNTNVSDLFVGVSGASERFSLNKHSHSRVWSY